MKMECDITTIFIVLILIAICFIIYYYMNNLEEECERDDMKNTKQDLEKVNNIEELQNNKKILKYFGGANCPHSKEGSRACNMVHKFEKAYPHVDVQYIWSGTSKEASDEFIKGQIRFVPTTLNSDYQNVALSLSAADQVDSMSKTSDEIELALFRNIYDQL